MTKQKYIEILKASTKLGLTSFGGPTAHLGYFRDEYVVKRKWLDDKAYADLVALCQFLPGPASSQVGISVGMLRGGIFGGFLSWFGFTMPSVILLVLFAMLMMNGSFDSGWIQGLKIVAVAVVAHALMGMGKSLAPDKPRIAIAVGSAVAILMMPTAWAQIGVIVLTGIIGYFLYRGIEAPEAVKLALTFGKKTGLAAWAIFAGLLIGLPLLRPVIESSYYAIFDIFYRVGSIVFGGGHVVLPMLEREVVPGWMSADLFISGYGAAQAVPGPLFTLSGYLGQVMGGGFGVLLAVVAMFLPSFLLVIGTLPFWSVIRTKSGVQAALKGVNAGVVGILLAALYDPVFTSGIRGPVDFAIAIIAFTMLVYFKLAPWIVVLITAILGAGAYAFL
ncbi:chromate efflux transporter [Planococcus shenhongbingii]|uniref:Chromate efflux transporter n=1 Tax=Planococcus shenhongbingii TaxID=3058398 RepID=A0ABT8NHG4_9BACL|nr:chromate efflux transporter [Planococcus sp. N017]MDN7247351.1 chromate efflux transporter [Planococcus sp. N017]